MPCCWTRPPLPRIRASPGAGSRGCSGPDAGGQSGRPPATTKGSGGGSPRCSVSAPPSATSSPAILRAGRCSPGRGPRPCPAPGSCAPSCSRRCRRERGRRERGRRRRLREGPATRLRVAYRRRLLALAAGDLAGELTLEQVMAGLSDLAEAALEAALAIARSRLPPGAPPCRLAVIAMGKCGGRELNYASDVDVIFVAEPAGDEPEDAALRSATRLATTVIQVLSQPGAEGRVFPVDPNLRPEGRD